MRLYHGSDVAVGHPLITFNDGFADLGRGFYLTNDQEVAHRRALSRARRTGGIPVVSVFELDEEALPWVSWGATTPVLPSNGSDDTFGLRFDETESGIAAWVDYLKACRAGQTDVAGLGSPAVVRAWIATEEVEMVCAGFATAEDLAQEIDPAELVVQYCLTDQGFIDRHLSYIETLD